jgi:hypothetical protein
MKLRQGIFVAAVCGVLMALPGSAGAAKLSVCADGCDYATIQKAVNHVKNASKTTIQIAPGTYNEDVVVSGQKMNGLAIEGTGDSPDDVVLDGEPPEKKGPYPDYENGIDGLNVNHLKVSNLMVQNYEANGVFIHADPGKDCHGFRMDNLVAAFNRSYGLFAKHCTGGRIVHSEGYGHGDSAIYIGETPPQPKNDRHWTQIAHNLAYENVLGYSGTNSKYVDIHNNEFFNNGAGVVPNTLDSELFEPNADGIIENNKVFWNNFNYYLPESPVQTVSGGLGQIPPELGGGTVYYPIGVGVVLFGSDHWIVRDNQIFGNNKWGTLVISDPFNDQAMSQDNKIVDNVVGRDGTDPNGTDFWHDGSGKGTCFEGNDGGSAAVTFGIASGSSTPQSFLYPTCPAPDPPDAGTGSTFGDTNQLFDDLVPYVTADPPCSMETCGPPTATRRSRGGHRWRSTERAAARSGPQGECACRRRGCVRGGRAGECRAAQARDQGGPTW